MYENIAHASHWLRVLRSPAVSDLAVRAAIIRRAARLLGRAHAAGGCPALVAVLRRHLRVEAARSLSVSPLSVSR